jgi:hypothetical protein
MLWKSPSRRRSSRYSLVATAGLDGRRPANSGLRASRFIAAIDQGLSRKSDNRALTWHWAPFQR